LIFVTAKERKTIIEGKDENTTNFENDISRLRKASIIITSIVLIEGVHWTFPTVSSKTLKTPAMR